MALNEVDRNLLFGFLALQNSFLTREELIAAVSVWLADKSRDFAAILCERKAVNENERQILTALMNLHLERHGNDAERSLAALKSVGDVCGDLQKLNDSEVEATITHVRKQPTANDHGGIAAELAVARYTREQTRFQILRPHAAGGLGQVYVARDEELNREVALKEIQANYADNPVSRSRFVLEAEVTGGLEHPGIVPVYGLGQYSDGRPYYAMRFIRGDSLKDEVAGFFASARGGKRVAADQDSESVDRKPPAQLSKSAFASVEFRNLLGRFIDVCQAIEYAHSRGVLHRDLKPGNIMLGKYGETLVVDWGLAKTQGRDELYQHSDERTLHPRSSSGSAATC